MLDFGQEKKAKRFLEFLVSNIHTDLSDLTDSASRSSLFLVSCFNIYTQSHRLGAEARSKD